MNMKYREVYKVIAARRNAVAGLRVSDFSGWKVSPQTYITRSQPLWIVIEDPEAGRRYWVTHNRPDMAITYQAIDVNGHRCGDSFRVKCRTKTELAEKLKELFDGTAAQRSVVS